MHGQSESLLQEGDDAGELRVSIHRCELVVSPGEKVFSSQRKG